MAQCFNFFNKYFFRPIWNIDFSKNVFLFWYSSIISNFKFRTFLIIYLFIKVNIYAWLYINRLLFNCSMIFISAFINYIILFINIHIFWYWSHMLIILFFKVLINLSTTTDFPSLCVKYISIAFFYGHDFIDLLQKSLSVSSHPLLGLRFDLFKTFWEALVIAISFLCFKGITHAHLLRISGT